jgi:archaeosine synthase
MEFKIKDRDGPSRICELNINDEILLTPNVLFLNTSRFKSPSYADILISNSNKKIKKPNICFYDIKKINNNVYNPDKIEKINIKKKNILTISNSKYLFNKKIKLIDLIVKSKEKFSVNNLLYLPAIGDISNFSLMTYMGIDLFDCISAIILARKNILMFSTGNKNIQKLEKIPCRCKFCKNYIDDPYLIPFDKILNHNYLAIYNEIINIRNEIKNGTLRDLVEIRVKSNTDSTALLRILDENYYDFIEENTAIIKNQTLIATTKESFKRAEIRRFQERLINRYTKPNSAKILLFLPCSAKKPYSFSKSHKKYSDQILRVSNHDIIHEVIITSPIGLVPRELELIYPASNYDIPITNVWDEDEKKMIQKILSDYLKINHYDKFIIHLPKNMRGFISDYVKNPIITKITNSPSSKESLKSLYKILKEESEKYPLVNRKIRRIENMKSLLSYQFNKKMSDILLEKCLIKGKYPFSKIFYNNTQIGMITKNRGYVSLTNEGGKRISKFKNYNVEIYDDFILKGSIFCPGVKSADPGIRIGDEVFVIQNNQFCGIGVAQVNGKEMIKLDYGEAVKIRHKV